MSDYNPSKATTRFRPYAIGIAAIAILTAASYIAVPVYPVPMTLQTLAVLGVGVILGPRLGFATVCTWLIVGLAGAPVLAGGKAGLSAFIGPTAGYLIAFPISAWAIGVAAERRWIKGFTSCFAGFLLAHILILIFGWLWLSQFLGFSAAFDSGVVPFLVGAALKSGLGAAGFSLIRGKP